MKENRIINRRDSKGDSERSMKKLWILSLLLCSFVFSQNVVTDFFKYSTVYAGFNLSSPKWEDDRYRLQLIDPETGQPDWFNGGCNSQQNSFS